MALFSPKPFSPAIRKFGKIGEMVRRERQRKKEKGKSEE
jgi:hypothetical protein